MWDQHCVVDADGHVMEPSWLWEKYVEPEFRADCMRVERDPVDGDKLVVAGRPSRLIRRLGGVRPQPGSDVVDWNSMSANGEYVSYDESCLTASFSGPDRLAWLDGHGMDATLLFPSLGLIWPREVEPSSPYAVAHYRAYDRWVLDMASVDPARLLPVALAAVGTETPPAEEVQRLAATGFRHVMFPLGTSVANRPDLDQFLGAAEEHELVVHLHKVAIPHFLELPSATSVKAAAQGSFFNHVNEILPGQLALAALLDAKVPDRFPTVRFAFHECNAGWLPAWLDRAQESWETLGAYGTDRPEHPPTAYFFERDTFFFSTGLAENLQRLPPEMYGRVQMATDYPHPGTPADPRAEWVDVLAELPADLVGPLLGGNALRMLGKDS